MKREIKNTMATCEPVVLNDFIDDPADWFSRQMRTHNLTYLLAHADDGVIWGRLASEELITSHEVAPAYSPPLRVETLQTARIFGPAGEILVWRDEAGAWAGRLITETTPGAPPAWDQAFEEEHILWGTEAEPRARGFTLMREGTQGLIHIVPLAVTARIDEEHRPLRLVVRHYVKPDEYGFLQVNASRLFDLEPKPKESNP